MNRMNYEQMLSLLQPGKQIANAIQGPISQNRWDKFSAKIKDPILLVKSILQRELVIQQIVIPYINDFLNVCENEQMVIYKGVSYNPYVTQLGENINLIDFFSYLARINSKGLILNASPYAVVNYERTVPALYYSSDTARIATKKFIEWFLQNNGIAKSSNQRGKYLEAMSIVLFPQKQKPTIINAEELWSSEKYQFALQEAIEFCSGCKSDGEKLNINRYANYNRYDTEYQRWYSVLVLAEVIYLHDVFGVNVKLGPTSESNFDNLIRKAMTARNSRFAFIWYDRSIEKVLSIGDKISFNDTAEIIGEKINHQPILASWLEELFFPFQLTGTTCQKTIELVNRINKVFSKVEVPKLNEGGFLSAFPIGECD